MESTLLSKMHEHDLLDAQFQAEHEEEVRALRQQKQMLVRQLEELKSHYQQAINEHEKQVNVQLLLFIITCHNIVIVNWLFGLDRTWYCYKMWRSARLI